MIIKLKKFGINLTRLHSLMINLCCQIDEVGFLTYSATAPLNSEVTSYYMNSTGRHQLLPSLHY